MFITMSVGGVLTAVAIGATVGAVTGYIAVVKVKAAYRVAADKVIAQYVKLKQQSGH